MKRRKKSEVDVTKQVLAKEIEGVIDLDNEPSLPLQVGDKVDTASQGVATVVDSSHVGFTPGVSAQAPARPKRKYTRRAAKKVEADITGTPTFIDKVGIRAARVQAFIDYVDGNRTFDSAASYDDHLRKLLATADEISARLLTDAHAKATTKINRLAEQIDQAEPRSRADVEL